MSYPAFETLRATLDQLSVAVVILAVGGELMFGNSAAMAMLEAGWPLRLADGHLQAKDRDVNAALKEAFEFVLSAECADSSRYEVCLAQPTAERQGAIGHVRLLALPASEPTIALFIIQPGGPAAHHSVEGLAEAYGLSKAETRTLNALMEAGSPAEAAARLNVAVSTAKSHLRKIFQKTNTSRQADLLRLVERTRTPLRKSSG